MVNGDIRFHITNLRQGYTKVLAADRGTDYGNPFIMHGTSDIERDRVCDLYEQYAQWRLTVEPMWLKKAIDTITLGWKLGCWCAPKRCHLETIVRLALLQIDVQKGDTIETQ